MISKVEFLQQDFQNVRCFPKRTFWNKFSRTYEILEQVFCNKSYETHEMLFSETEFLKQNFQENFLKTMKYIVDEFFETNFLPNTTLYSLSLSLSSFCSSFQRVCSKEWKCNKEDTVLTMATVEVTRCNKGGYFSLFHC